MLSINDLSYYIGGRPIYEDASLHINEKDKVGLVGPNGSGKTTLLRIILGDLQIDNGSVSKQKDCNIGILNQEISIINESLPILVIALQAFDSLLKIKEKIDGLIIEIENDHDEKKIEQLAQLQEEFEIKGGYSLQSKAEEILEGIGFKTSDLTRPISEFSGGWKMRVMLAKLLLEKPSILMLDEPTNHLDLPSIKWFENYVKTYDGSVIIVSHDKRFLDNTTNKIIEIEDLKLIQYTGNYSNYIEEKTMRQEVQNNAHLNQQKKIKEAEKFINRFRAKATKARQVQSKIKLMDKIDLVEKSRNNNKDISFEFRLGQPSGKHVLDLKQISKSYGKTKIFDHTSASIMKNDKIALIGANGLGKSTLLKIISQTIPFEGTCSPGHNVNISYYAQHQIDALNYKNNILEELSQTDSEYTELELRSILGSFLFSGDDVFKKIKNLSGGEKARVALAKALISKANFLVMDEPTNHLDITSVDILSEALRKFQGSLIMVSHDRQFIEVIANKIWYIENKKIKEYPGTYSDYEFREGNLSKVKKTEQQKPEERSKKLLKSRSFEDQKKLKNKLNSLNNKLQTLEEEISIMEAKKEKIEEEMLKPEVYSDYEKLSGMTTEFENLEININKKHRAWEKMFSEIEELELTIA
ncbi:MAG: ABC-F family ATP-binding cassette domain-containing protein [Cyclobacteriaceae bacterium]|jgi:ATP-binding cassette subfamily F protein 3